MTQKNELDDFAREHLAAPGELPDREGGDRLVAIIILTVIIVGGVIWLLTLMRA